MHPRSDSRVPAEDVGSPWPAAQRKKAQLLLEFVRERGAVHPREVDEHFSWQSEELLGRLIERHDPLARRDALLWDWVYRFEAYTPAPKRKLGYYAMPLLWRDRVIGWGNLLVKNGELKSEFGYVASRQPRDRAFKRELEAELDRMRAFLGLGF